MIWERHMYLLECILLIFLRTVACQNNSGLIVSLPLSSSTVVKGSSLVLACGAKSNKTSPQITFKWYKDGSILNMSSTSINSAGSALDVFILNNVAANDAGKYKCIITAGATMQSTTGLVQIKEEDSFSYWMQVAVACAVAVFLLALLCLVLFIRLRKWQKQCLSYQGSMSRSKLFSRKSKKHPITNVYPVHIPLPGMGLPKFRVPIGEGLPLDRCSSTNSSLQTSGDALTGSAMPYSQKPDLVSSMSIGILNPLRETEDRFYLPGTKSVGAIDEAVYESCVQAGRGKGHRSRTTSEPPKSRNGSVQYTSIDINRKESLVQYAQPNAYSNEVDDRYSENNNSQDHAETPTKRKIDKPVPVPRPKKERQISQENIIPEDPQDEIEDDYLKPCNEDEDAEDYITPEHIEPRYINSKPDTPERDDKNLYDAVQGRPSIDEGEESYYLKLESSLYRGEQESIYA